MLHTGDFRAEPLFVESILKNPVLQPYFSAEIRTPNGELLQNGRNETLEAIYLDTASLTCIDEIPTKVGKQGRFGKCQN